MLTYENLSFSLSIGAFAGLYKFMLCFLWWLWNKDDNKNTLFATVFGSISILFDRNKNSQRALMYLMIGRAFDCLKNIITSKTKLKKIPYFEVLIMNLFGAFMWFFTHPTTRRLAIHLSKYSIKLPIRHWTKELSWDVYINDLVGQLLLSSNNNV